MSNMVIATTSLGTHAAVAKQQQEKRKTKEKKKKRRKKYPKTKTKRMQQKNDDSTNHDNHNKVNQEQTFMAVMPMSDTIQLINMHSHNR